MPYVDGQFVNWSYKLRNFKGRVLELDREEPFSTEEIQAKAKLFWDIVKSPIHKKFMEDFIEENELYFDPDTINSVEEFDELMEALYDYCDYNLIWVE